MFNQENQSRSTLELGNKTKEHILLRIRNPEEVARLDKYLIHHFGDLAFSNLQKLIRKKDIKVNGQKTENNYQLVVGDVVSMPKFIYSSLKDNKPIRFDNNTFKKGSGNFKLTLSEDDVSDFRKNIVFEDKNLIVLNKPSGLAVQDGSKIEKSVDQYLKYLKSESGEIPVLVHRIDKDTSGLLLIAKNKMVADVLGRFFQMKDNMEKIYLAIVVGRPTKLSGVISLPLIKKFHGSVEKVYVDLENGKPAITEYEVIDYSAQYDVSLMRIKIITGRTHQIRVHMKEIGYPILGDGKYGNKRSYVDGLSNRVHLHAYKMKINNFVGKTLDLTADLKDHFVETMKLTGLKVN